jgi:site-specific DNA recombinase
MTIRNRSVWVSYLRVSNPEQAAKDLSLPAQREAVEEYARRNGQVISREHIESGCFGTDINRKAFRQMLEDVLRPGSDIGTIVVHHTSRFTRNATQARVVKEQLRKQGVKVLSVCQELNDDPIGQLIEGIFECIDQYESEINGMRTIAAMREAVCQGFFPGSMPPYGFKANKIEVRPGLFRSVLRVDEHEAAIVRELFQLYVANNGAKSVARKLNRRGRWYRKSKSWSKDLVLKVLEESAVAGTYWWGKHDAKTGRKKNRSEWLPLKVEWIVEPDLYDLARRLRSQREPSRNPGRAPSPEMLLCGLVRCARCGSSYTLESSGKKANGAVYQYRYYNCRTTCRVGKEACPGGRVPASKLDSAVLEFIAGVVCAEGRCVELVGLGGAEGRRSSATPEAEEMIANVREAWSTMIRSDPTVARNYLHHLVEHIQIDENRITVIPKEAFKSMM